MTNPDVIAHLEKYFDLSKTQFTEGDYALATFFAITTIEEAAKLLILEAKSPEGIDSKELQKVARNHRSKYFSALMNLIDQSPQYPSLRQEYEEEIRSWWVTDRLMELRNDCLYLNYDNNNQVTTPQKAVDIQQAALLVYIAGIALAELDEYISGLPSGWKQSMLKANEEFRSKFLRG